MAWGLGWAWREFKKSKYQLLGSLCSVYTLVGSTWKCPQLRRKSSFRFDPNKAGLATLLLQQSEVGMVM